MRDRYGSKRSRGCHNLWKTAVESPLVYAVVLPHARSKVLSRTQVIRTFRRAEGARRRSDLTKKIVCQQRLFLQFSDITRIEEHRTVPLTLTTCHLCLTQEIKMNRRWLYALAIVLVWTFLVLTMRNREHQTNPSPPPVPTLAGLFTQVQTLSNQVDKQQDEIDSLQAANKSAQQQIAQGQAQVAAASAGLDATVASS